MHEAARFFRPSRPDKNQKWSIFGRVTTTLKMCAVTCTVQGLSRNLLYNGVPIRPVLRRTATSNVRARVFGRDPLNAVSDDIRPFRDLYTPPGRPPTPPPGHGSAF